MGQIGEKDTEKLLALRDMNLRCQALQQHNLSLKTRVAELQDNSAMEALKAEIQELKNELEVQRYKQSNISEKSQNKFIKAQWRLLEDEKKQLKNMKKNLAKKER